jgi:hypothetical protein
MDAIQCWKNIGCLDEYEIDAVSAKTSKAATFNATLYDAV